MCCEIHEKSQRFVLFRPYPALPGIMANIFDVFSMMLRSPTGDAIVLLALLAKLAWEPLVFLSESAPSAGLTVGSAISGQPPTPAGATVSQSSSNYRRLTGLILRDTAVHLLESVFGVTGPAFAASPLLVAGVGRMVVPSLLSHALTPRIAHSPISICPTSEKDGGGMPMSASALNRQGGGDGAPSAAAGLVPTTSVLRAVMRVVAALWAARGSEDAGNMASAAAAAAAASASGDENDGTPASVREACAREISVVVRALLLPTLASKAAPPTLRMDALEELSGLVAVPQQLMELYINHDMHPASATPYPHSRLLRSLFATLVAIVTAKRRAYFSGVGDVILEGGSIGAGGGGLAALALADEALALAQIVHPDNLPATATPAERQAAWDAFNREELRRSSASLVTSIVRGLMDAAATVNLEPGQQELDYRPPAHAFACAHPGLALGNVALGAAPLSPPGSPQHGPSRSGSAVAPPAPMGLGVFSRAVSLGGSGASAAALGPGVPVRALHDRQNEMEAAFVAALPIFAEKGVKKGLAPLFEKGYVHKSGGGVAHFLRLCGHELGASDAEVGDYLGDEGRSPDEIALSGMLRRAYLGGMSFAGMTVSQPTHTRAIPIEVIFCYCCTAVR
jgi:hypothetical protein